MDYQSKKYLTVAFAIIVGTGLILYVARYERTPALSFSPTREEIYLVRGTFFKSERLKLRSASGKWNVIENKWGLPIEISTPYTLKYNNYYDVILEQGGTLALVSKDKLERSELRWIDGQWKHKDPSTTEWLEFGDPEEPER